jgi:methylated-DNA-[protein]-cysteine S-methyltransferase
MLYTTVDSPVGELLLSGDGEALAGLWFPSGSRARRPALGWRRDDAAFAAVAEQLGEYWARERTTFDLPLRMHGTEFEQAVWQKLREIPYGETTSYGALALSLGLTGHGARAVGRANGQNPIAIIVPCHRVIGADGSLTGFGGGLERKRLLLELESPPAQLSFG